jgi:predicted membrane-bound spermidine synthase
MKRLPVAKISLLLFGSGFCALVYQVAWLRLLRLIFGSSTPATAAVVAIFMGGIGLGSLILGPKSDRESSPLGFYAWLELGISVGAAVSPFLILLARWIYIAAGGSQQLGPALGTSLRLLLATLVLGLPTFLMGGTLPAVTRAVERSEDRGRRRLGLLYGANTLGAVLGALATTFFSIEVLGIRRTIWIACLLNLLVALLARRLARRLAVAHRLRSLGRPPGETRPAAALEPAADRGLVRLVLPAAAAVGFAFFLMELVWYRMLAPLLGGSSYTFGLILAVALFGIGIGGLVYGAGARQRRPTLLSFAVTCSLEALCLIIPFALGDRLAAATLVLRDLGGMGFSGLVLSWSLVVAAVVLPAALVAGYQFPLLVAILGTGRHRVGSEVGRTYAWNTVGAIAGSLAGGFGLLPLLSAPGAWRFSAILLVALAGVAALAGRRAGRRHRIAWPLALGLLALVLSRSPGPTAFWRHSPIGAGRAKITFEDSNQLRQAIHR